MIIWAKYVARMEEIRNIYTQFIQLQVRRQFRRDRREFEDNIKMILNEKDVDWIHVAQDRYQWQALFNR
jgi:hypothetical protein